MKYIKQNKEAISGTLEKLESLLEQKKITLEEFHELSTKLNSIKFKNNSWFYRLSLGFNLTMDIYILSITVVFLYIALTNDGVKSILSSAFIYLLKL